MIETYSSDQGTVMMRSLQEILQSLFARMRANFLERNGIRLDIVTEGLQGRVTTHLIICNVRPG